MYGDQDLISTLLLVAVHLVSWPMAHLTWSASSHKRYPTRPKQMGAAGVKGVLKIKVFYIPLSLQPASPFTTGDNWEKAEGGPSSWKHKGHETSGGMPA